MIKNAILIWKNHSRGRNWLHKTPTQNSLKQAWLHLIELQEGVGMIFLLFMYIPMCFFFTFYYEYFKTYLLKGRKTSTINPHVQVPVITFELLIFKPVCFSNEGFKPREVTWPTSQLYCGWSMAPWLKVES